MQSRVSIGSGGNPSNTGRELIELMRVGRARMSHATTKATLEMMMALPSHSSRSQKKKNKLKVVRLLVQRS